MRRQTAIALGCSALACAVIFGLHLARHGVSPPTGLPPATVVPLPMEVGTDHSFVISQRASDRLSAILAAPSSAMTAHPAADIDILIDGKRYGEHAGTL